MIGVRTGWRDLVIAATVGAGLGAYLLLWFRWPIPISIGAAVVLAILVFATSRSLARDPREADEAWRAAAPDLVEPRVGPLDPSSSSDGATSASRDRASSSEGGSVEGAPSPDRR